MLDDMLAPTRHTDPQAKRIADLKDIIFTLSLTGASQDLQNFR